MLLAIRVTSLLLIVGILSYWIVINLNGYLGSQNKYGVHPCNYDAEGSWSIAFASIESNTAGPLKFKEIFETSSNKASIKPGQTRSNAAQTVILQSGEVGFLNPLAVTCQTASRITPDGAIGTYSFTADPFLFLPPTESRSLGFTGFSRAGISLENATNVMFAFYEMKNLMRMKGEIGVSVSSDLGYSFQHIGTVITSSEHLSYPFVVFDQFSGDGIEDGEIVMFPQSTPLVTSLKGLIGSQRVYATKPSLFPFGWKHVSTPLMGGKYVDASPIHYLGRWYVWVTEVIDIRAHVPAVYHLNLYIISGPRLSTGTWTLHPSSPLTTDKRYARMGGRPVIDNGRLLRPAQDCSNGYGVGVTYMHVILLTDSHYEEVPFQEIKPIDRIPNATATDRSNYLPWVRLHHIDAQELSPGKWVALVDGER